MPRARHLDEKGVALVADARERALAVVAPRSLLEAVQGHLRQHVQPPATVVVRGVVQQQAAQQVHGVPGEEPAGGLPSGHEGAQVCNVCARHAVRPRAKAPIKIHVRVGSGGRGHCQHEWAAAVQAQVLVAPGEGAEGGAVGDPQVVCGAQRGVAIQGRQEPDVGWGVANPAAPHVVAAQLQQEKPVLPLGEDVRDAGDEVEVRSEGVPLAVVGGPGVVEWAGHQHGGVPRPLAAASGGAGGARGGQQHGRDQSTARAVGLGEVVCEEGGEGDQPVPGGLGFGVVVLLVEGEGALLVQEQGAGGVGRDLRVSRTASGTGTGSRAAARRSLAMLFLV